jgi:hypothetical protein
MEGWSSSREAYQMSNCLIISEVIMNWDLLQASAIKSWWYLYDWKKQNSPATRHGGAWGERRYSSYSFTTSALDGCEWSASRPGRALSPGKGPPLPIVQEAGWAPEPVWTQRLKEKSFRLCRGSNLDRPVLQPVARHCTDWATQLLFMTIFKKVHWNILYIFPAHLVPSLNICGAITPLPHTYSWCGV